VPIIKKNNWSINFIGKVPMVIVEEWSELTPEYLEKEYETFAKYLSIQGQLPDVANYNYYVHKIKNDEYKDLI